MFRLQDKETHRKAEKNGLFSEWEVLLDERFFLWNEL